VNTNIFKIVLIINFLYFSSVNASQKATTCTDVQNIPMNIKQIAHEQARKRAQQEVEELLGKKLKNQYDIGMFSTKHNKSLNESTILTIETYWCYPGMPLHSAYFLFYTSNYNFLFK